MNFNFGSNKSSPAKVDPTLTADDGGWRETAKIIIHALLIAFVVRVFFYQPFNIPSGSMKDTLLVGDYLFVSKLSYGYSRYSFPLGLPAFTGRIFGSEPKRGDVAVFKLPRDNSTDYIKRVIGLPGDEIQMRNGVLHINGQAVPKTRVADFTAQDEDGVARSTPRYQETLPNGVKYYVLDAEPNGAFDNTGVYKVPARHYFMMGDNRDNSTDSRVTMSVGPVPYDNFVGRADVMFFSVAIDEGQSCHLLNPLRWPGCVRWRRLFNLVR
ncbi:MAG: signal peptidase I [Hyphomicrobiaceae bacterium]|nr:signal peptidase I [Hyphomicrobiaceae bacterium]